MTIECFFFIKNVFSATPFSIIFRNHIDFAEIVTAKKFKIKLTFVKWFCIFNFGNNNFD